jgi:hypothetical protein
VTSKKKKEVSIKKTPNVGAASAKKGSPRVVPLSPLLRSGLEVLDHGLWHFFRSETSTDMKFAILHVDQSIELFLKEKVRASGKSIYKNPKETISIFGAYDTLAILGIQIPEKPDLELLHEERNIIQHKYATLSAQDAAFHIDKAMRFFKRFLKTELDVAIEAHVPSEYIEQLGI